MRFELDKKDLSDLSAIQRYFSFDDMVPGHLYQKITRIVKKINSQIPDPTPPGATRRIKVFTLDK